MSAPDNFLAILAGHCNKKKTQKKTTLHHLLLYLLSGLYCEAWDISLGIDLRVRHNVGEMRFHLQAFHDYAVYLVLGDSFRHLWK